MSTVPETSKEAKALKTQESKNKDYAKIINALTVLGTGIYEQISDFCGCREPNVISRRLKELEEKQLIYKTGEKRLTKRNRNAFVYCLTNQMPKVENTQPPELVAYKPNEKSAADYAQNIIQQSLFQ
jgi:hypothetical protein